MRQILLSLIVLFIFGCENNHENSNLSRNRQTQTQSSADGEGLEVNVHTHYINIDYYHDEMNCASLEYYQDYTRLIIYNRNEDGYSFGPTVFIEVDNDENIERVSVDLSDRYGCSEESNQLVCEQAAATRTLWMARFRELGIERRIRDALYMRPENPTFNFSPYQPPAQ